MKIKFQKSLVTFKAVAKLEHLYKKWHIKQTKQQTIMWSQEDNLPAENNLSVITTKMMSDSLK